MIYTIENIKHCYNGKLAFDTKSLSIPKASITGLTGPNGAGKTTLLMILALIQKPTSGIVMFKGKPVQPFAKTAKSHITILNQEPFLLKRSVFQNIAYGLKLRKDTKNLEKRVHNVLATVGLDGRNFASRSWSELSGGETRRVALAARLILNPDVLILDEPTANIDAESSILIRKAALNAREVYGTTLIISSHDRDWLYDVSDTVLNIFNGKILQGNRVNPIFGPWESAGKTLYNKTGTDFLVPEPPELKSVAFISADSLGICETSTNRPDNTECFMARLKSVTIDKKTNKRYCTLISNELTLLADYENCRPASFKPEPGHNVVVFYNPELIKFTS